MEKEEALSLRHAMEDMDLKCKKATDEDDDSRIYQAALNEASELVWQHQNGHPTPEPDAPYRYRPHLRKNSYAYARTASVSKPHNDMDSNNSWSSQSRTPSGGSIGTLATECDIQTLRSTQPVDPIIRDTTRFTRPKSYGGLNNEQSHPTRNRRSSMKRNISGEIEAPFSGDQIWEETTRNTFYQPNASQLVDESRGLNDRQRNHMNRVQFVEQANVRFDSTSRVKSMVHIHQNPPSRSRNPLYKTNVPAIQTPNDDHMVRKHGMEVRSDEIRQATGMRLKDRSPKLPTPTAVSDNPGRPIVSFNNNWQPAGDRSRQEQARIGTSSTNQSNCRPGPTSTPTIVVSATNVQECNVSTIKPNQTTQSCSGVGIPVIVTPDDEEPSHCRPLPNPQSVSRQRNLRLRKQHPWPPAPNVGRPGATCHECGFPIEGKFVALAGCSQRFHPQCFSCFTCGTSLEALEISPEPENHRTERLERIHRRQAGEILGDLPGKTADDDGDERLRFYCHLDWHELFAPRCKHCKTPILGEHVVALGEHWHYGHFFCAECGDPFKQGMTHIEKDGYAWCVSCQTKRTERRAPKCKKCRLPVIGQYIQAFGGEWHDECFRCATCGGGFEDGQIFPRDGQELSVLCTRCREIELKC
jgi:hypothetical protein